MLGTLDTGNAAWVLVSAALVLFMTPGLALFYGGMARGKNVLNMLMMNFWCLLVVPLLPASWGLALCMGAALGLAEAVAWRLFRQSTEPLPTAHQ